MDAHDETTTTSLAELGEELLAKARTANSGRAATTVHGGQARDLRQTVIALLQGHALGEHESPGEATLQVLVGRVRLTADHGAGSWECSAGDLLVIPPVRHDLAALSDAVVLLTVATRA